MNLTRELLAAALILATCGFVAQPLCSRGADGQAGVGAIEGVVIYESDRERPWRYRRYYVQGRTEGPLAEAVVCLDQIRSTAQTAARPQAARTWKIDQKDYRFIPETLAIRRGDRVEFGNSDPLLHDVTATQATGLSEGDVRQHSLSLSQHQAAARSYTDAGGLERPVTLSCKFHSAMRGWIFVFDHPFFQVTSVDGRFRLEEVPAGQVRLTMLHPAGQLRWQQEIDIAPGQTTRVEIRVSPNHLLPAPE